MPSTTVVKSYAVEAFLCNSLTGARLAAGSPFSQGSLPTACVRPNAEARDDGVTIDRIESFSWKKVGTDIIQPAVVEGSIDNNGLSEYACAPDNTYCSVASMLFSSFFQTAGTVEGFGSAYLGFGAEDPVLSNFSFSIGGGSTLGASPSLNAGLEKEL